MYKPLKSRLRGLARDAVAVALRFSGLPWIIRSLGERGNRATILVYHNPRRADFERHLAFLSARYSFITLDLLVEAIRSKDWSILPRRPLVITIDDGRRENYELLPTAMAYGVRPTLFICTRIVGSARPFWFLTVGKEEKKRLKSMSNTERASQLKSQDGALKAGQRQALSESEMQEMSAAFNFESHTCTHPVLPNCTNEECRQELEQSRRDIEALFRRPCLHFAFPHGDYGDRDCEVARESGYRSARTIDLGWNDVNTDPYRLKVQGVTDDASNHMLAVQLSGIVVYLKYFLQGSFFGRKPRAHTGGGY